jgi:predicted transcriptional regulator
MQHRYNRQILDPALSGETKTKIMMYANLNRIQIKRYIRHVFFEQLREKRNNPIESSPVYATNEKGRIFLQKYMGVQLYRIE